MKPIIRFFALWGMADGLWLAANPPAWAKFWERTIGLIVRNNTLPRMVAGLQFLVCLWLLTETGKERRSIEG